jgi:hypothetical protein
MASLAGLEPTFRSFLLVFVSAFEHFVEPIVSMQTAHERGVGRGSSIAATRSFAAFASCLFLSSSTCLQQRRLMMTHLCSSRAPATAG